MRMTKDVNLMHNYITIQGDTWDMISYKVYGDEKYMDILMDVNPLYIHVVVFSANIELIVPTLPEDKISQLPPWKVS
mgnify:CR=1 FL=1